MFINAQTLHRAALKVSSDPSRDPDVISVVVANAASSGRRRIRSTP